MERIHRGLSPHIFSLPEIDFGVQIAPNALLIKPWPKEAVLGKELSVLAIIYVLTCLGHGSMGTK